MVLSVLPETEQDTEERGYGILVMKTDTLRCSAIQYERERSVSQQESQPYDRALKSLLGDETAEILPNLLPESELVGEENIEIDRTTLKADLVYTILYKGQPHILNYV